MCLRIPRPTSVARIFMAVSCQVILGHYYVHYNRRQWYIPTWNSRKKWSVGPCDVWSNLILMTIVSGHVAPHEVDHGTRLKRSIISYFKWCQKCPGVRNWRANAWTSSNSYLKYVSKINDSTIRDCPTINGGKKQPCLLTVFIGCIRWLFVANAGQCQSN